MESELQHFLLILIRISTFISLSPGFSNRAFPTTAKLGISLALSVIVMGSIPQLSASLPMGLFLVTGIKELLIGMALAYITLLFFTTVEIAGTLVDFQVGFSMGQIYDPSLCREINLGISSYMARHQFEKLSELTGSLQINE